MKINPTDHEIIARQKLRLIGRIIGGVTLFCAIGVLIAVVIYFSREAPTPETYAPPVPRSIDGMKVDADAGRQLFAQNCASCHGKNGEGMLERGVNLRDSAFVHLNSDSKLLKFLHTGRRANDPGSILKIEMPPKGANPLLDDQQLGDLVDYLRQLQIDARQNRSATTAP